MRLNRDPDCDICKGLGIVRFEQYSEPCDCRGPSDCPDCDGFGSCWNGADPSSGQQVDCETCGDTRGHP